MTVHKLWHRLCLVILPGGMSLALHWENCISISFQIEWDMIVVTVFLSIFNQMEVHLVQNWKENCHHDHIPFYVKGNGNIVFSVLVHSGEVFIGSRYSRLHWGHSMMMMMIIRGSPLCPSVPYGCDVWGGTLIWHSGCWETPVPRDWWYNYSV